MLATALVTTSESAVAGKPFESHRHVARDDLQEHISAGQTRTVDAKQHLFREGDPATHIFQVELGNVCVYRTMADGRRQIIDFAYPGDFVGLGAINEHTDCAQATAKTRLRCIPIPALREAVRADGQLGLRLCEAISRELQGSRELLFTVGRCTASERIATFLMALSRRNQRNGEDPREFVLPMTRADIADFLGLTIETVSRTFTKLRQDGVIDLAQSILVTIVDHNALARMADGQCV